MNSPEELVERQKEMIMELSGELAIEKLKNAELATDNKWLWRVFIVLICAVWLGAITTYFFAGHHA